MAKRKKLIIILSTILCLSMIGLLSTLGYEKNMQELKENKDKQTKIEDNYFEKADKLGLEKDRRFVNTITRNMKKINNQDRVFKLASAMLSEYNYFINTQQLKKAFEMLDTEYIEEFKINYNIFEAKNKGEIIEKYVITNIKEMKAEGIILVEYIIIKENGFLSEDMSIINHNGEYRLTLNGLSERTKIEVTHEVKGIKISIPRRYKIGNSVAYKLIIDNNTNQDLHISNHINGFFGIMQNQKYSHKIASVTTPHFLEDYVIRQGEKKEYIIKFNTVNYLEKIGIELKNEEIIEIPISEI